MVAVEVVVIIPFPSRADAPSTLLLLLGVDNLSKFSTRVDVAVDVVDGTATCAVLVDIDGTVSFRLL